MTSEQKHTPGPWVFDENEQGRCFNSGYGLVDGVGIPVYVHIPLVDINLRPVPAEANARLIAAAVTSYDKHCGPRAVECAEADAFGKCIEALRAIEALPFGSQDNSDYKALRIAQAALQTIEQQDEPDDHDD